MLRRTRHLLLAAFAIMAINPSFAGEAMSGDLPLEVRIDLLREQLAAHLRNDNNQGIVDLIPQFRALDLELPDNLYFLEGRALYRLGRALEARDRLIVYLRNTGRDGTYYQEATELLLALKEEADRQEQELILQERERREEAARRAEKARMLRIREAQSYLAEVGFRNAVESGTLDKPTREALAIYQIRRDLAVNGDITEETLALLKSEVPESHTCDELTKYPRSPTEFGIPIEQIATQVAIPSCNEALRLYPNVIRFQVQLARALASAGRTEDAVNELRNSIDLGYPEAETLMGWLHLTGKLSANGREDPESAAKWFARAAEKDYPPAQVALGNIANDDRDYSVAANWYALAANEGYPPGEVALGRLYVEGDGVSRDYDQAYTWIKRAADSGYPDGEYALGELYDRGRGVKRNRDEARRLYKIAADKGHAEAAKELSRP